MLNITVPKPSKTKKISNVSKLGAKKLPIADKRTSRMPNKIKGLYLNLTAKAPTSSADTNSPILFAVAIWLATPTDTPKVCPMSTKKSWRIVMDTLTDIVAITNDGIISLLGERS